MNKNKKTIGLVTNWYPTKENPFMGSFFREQALALDAQFDFVVIHYYESQKGLPGLHWLRSRTNKTFTIEKINQEHNITEYNICCQLPLWVNIGSKLYSFYSRLSGRAKEPGVGRQIWPGYLRSRKALLEKILTAFPEKPDLLYCVSAQGESSLVQTMGQILDKPYVVSEHAPFPWPGAALTDAEKSGIENADAFLAISYDKIRQVLLQNVRLRHIDYVGNLVDETQFSLGSGSGGVTTFVMVAAHSFYKNYPLFIEIFNRLKEITDAPFRVKIVGYNANKGYSQNAELLEQKIKASAFAENAELIGSVSRDQMHTVYGSSDAFVMTSVQEGMPVSALEAACCGLPIFSTMCGGVEDYVDDSVGRIFRIVDSEAFAQGLKEFLEGHITFDRQHIRQRVIDRYGKRAFTENMASIFNRVIDAHDVSQ